jgi:hypothetical protein
MSQNRLSNLLPAGNVIARWNSVHIADGGIDLINSSTSIRTAFTRASQLMLEKTYFQVSFAMVSTAPTAWRLIACIVPLELAQGGDVLTDEQLLSRPGARVWLGSNASPALTFSMKGQAYTSTTLVINKPGLDEQLASVQGQGVPTLYLKMTTYDSPASFRTEIITKSKWLATGLGMFD